MHNLRKRLVVVPMLLVCFAVSIVIIQQTMSFGGMGHADAAVFIFAAILLFHFLAFCIGLAVDFAWPTALLTVFVALAPALFFGALFVIRDF